MSAATSDKAIGARPWIVVVGGFLGAGKTTLLLAAARELERRGLRSALVMNDQGEALVDSEYSSLHGVLRGEVTGGCFCCRFSELVHEMDRLRSFSPNVIFAEPVGSCTDISATTLQPLREYSDQYRLAPFTVLVDPKRAKQMLAPDADANLKFLFKKQLEEADLICFTKSDVTSDYPSVDELSLLDIRKISARSGSGVAAWLDEVLSGELSAGSRILDIDYEQYACAEAALSWLNLQADIRPNSLVSPAGLLGPLFDDLDAALSAGRVSIVHMKAIMNSPTGFVKAAICANGQEPVVEGNLDASPAAKHNLLLNLRTLGAASEVQAIVEESLRGVDGSLDDLKISCFHPAAPKPERRIAEIRFAL
jgi:CobW/HypB/UreG family nucleotide-binding protein